MYFEFTKQKVQEIGDRPEVLMQVGGTSGGKAFVITFAYWIVGIAIGMMILFM
ncbi:hypothetical protein ACFO0S_08030 [Chryseomicrobium palamuruense]|uniref:Uncharacterized protein n=1 Tax=Chryseomicrobium palamuruense TaxID=682973 RepID=A0ABV8UUK1_9BACL